MKKAFFFIFLLILLLPNILFANGVIDWIDSMFGSSENNDLVYMPRTIVNNANVMIELSQSKAITTSTTSADFANSDDNHQAMFRLRDSLQNVSANNNLVLEITSDSGWTFVNESNAMETRPFSIGIICFDRKRNISSYESYTPYLLSTDSTHTLSNGEYVASSAWEKTTNLVNDGRTTASIKVSFDGTKYTVTIPTTTGDNQKPDYMRELDFCIVLDETINDLEAGYYSTTLHVKTNKQHTTSSSTGGPINETVTIRGYIGSDPGANSASYSFLVSSAKDTYSMNLNIQNHSQSTVEAYDVATVKFLYSEIVASEPSESTAKERFTIYISPTPVYTVSEKYQFIKLGTDNQARNDRNTVYYDLYIRTAANTYTQMKDGGGSTDKYKGTIGSWGKHLSATHTYYMKPLYNPTRISSSGVFGGETSYQLTWELDQDIWLKINDSSADSTNYSLGKVHSPGMYWSYIYLTLETTY